MTYDRPWRAYAQQLDLLKFRGMIIGDETLALHRLEHIGYYRLSAYWYPFRSVELTQLSNPKRITCNRKDLFEPGTQFEDALALYEFDKRLRLLLMDALERIEIALRVDIAYLLGARDAFAHLNAIALHPTFIAKRTNAGGKTAFDAWQEKYHGLLKRSKEDFVKHYRARHGTDLPIWVAVEVLDFGAVSRLLAMMKIGDQEQIAKKYGVKDWRVFQSWIRSLNYLRNLVAHHSRLWNRNVIDQPRLPVRYEISWCDAFIKRPDLIAKPFPLLAITMHIIRIVTPQSTWPIRFRTHLDVFPAQQSSRKLSIEDIGAPREWRKWWLENFPSAK